MLLLFTFAFMPMPMTISMPNAMPKTNAKAKSPRRQGLSIYLSICSWSPFQSQEMQPPFFFSKRKK